MKSKANSNNRKSRGKDEADRKSAAFQESRKKGKARVKTGSSNKVKERKEL